MVTLYIECQRCRALVARFHVDRPDRSQPQCPCCGFDIGGACPIVSSPDLTRPPVIPTTDLGATSVPPAADLTREHAQVLNSPIREMTTELTHRTTPKA